MYPPLIYLTRFAVGLVLAALCAVGAVHAEVGPVTNKGVPLLPVPAYEEVGLPEFTVPQGQPVFGGGAGTAPSTSGVTGDTTTSGGSASGDGSDSPAMTRMMSRDWGETAAQYAEQVGVTAVSVAATCTLESQCIANPGGTGTISGAFQMTDRTYTAMMQAVLRDNPQLAGQIDTSLAGKLDPANQSIAAAEYLRQGALALQGTNLPNPSVLDVRGYYNFGPAAAGAIARADDSAVMSDTVSLTDAQYRGNGITPGVTTVGQWRASIVRKIGATAANAPVLVHS